MEKYKSVFREAFNLDKIISGSLFKGDTARLWLEDHIDYFFNRFRKPLNFIYDSDNLMDIESFSFGKDDLSKIKEIYNKYKNKGTWFIKVYDGKTYKSKLPNELIELYLKSKD